MTNRQLLPEDIQPLETLNFEALDKRYIKVVITRIVSVYILLIACVALLPLLETGIGWGIIIIIESILVIAFAINLALTRKIYNIKGYVLREKDITYRKGIFFTSVTTIPFSKIQQVIIRTNPVSRMLKLYYLDVVNGSQGVSNRISIPGLSYEKAEKIKSLLIINTECDDD